MSATDKLTQVEMALFLIAVGNVMRTHALTFEEISGQITKEHFAHLRNELFVLGIKMRDADRVYELGCAEAFKRFP